MPAGTITSTRSPTCSGCATLEAVPTRMQQQVQTHLSPEQVITEAPTFFSKRRAKISDRASDGFRFGLPGSDESGHVRIASSGDAGSTVTVEAEGLAIMAIADGYVRELRKQAQAASRQTRPGGGGNVQLGDLRQRLGMPEPQPRPAPQRRPATPTNQGGQATSSIPAETSGTVAAGAPSPAGGQQRAPSGFVETGSDTPGVTRPDGPAPMEAATVSPETGPQGGPVGPSAIEGAHPSFVGPGDSNLTAADQSPPVDEGTSNVQPSAEAIGGVPAPDDVHVTGEPLLPNPGTPAGPAGSGAPSELGAEAAEAPQSQARQSGA